MLAVQCRKRNQIPDFYPPFCQFVFFGAPFAAVRGFRMAQERHTGTAGAAPSIRGAVTAVRPKALKAVGTLGQSAVFGFC